MKEVQDKTKQVTLRCGHVKSTTIDGRSLRVQVFPTQSTFSVLILSKHRVDTKVVGDVQESAATEPEDLME